MRSAPSLRPPTKLNAPALAGVLLLSAAFAACNTAGSSRSGDTMAPRRSLAATDTTVGPLAFHATAEIRAESLVVAVKARNVSGGTVHLAWGACSLSPRLYAPDSAMHAPVYDWLHHSNTTPPGPGGRACPMYLATGNIAPGDSLAPRELTVAVSTGELARDGVRPGEYEVGAWLRLNGLQAAGAAADSMLVRIGTLEVPR